MHIFPDSARKRPEISRRRFFALDSLRFLSAMGVVSYHYVSMADNPAIEAALQSNRLFVDLFFVISGFVIVLTYQARMGGWDDYARFLKNRIARIYPLHLLTLSIFVILSLTLWRDRVQRDFVDPNAILPNLLLVHAWGTTAHEAFNYPSWSISAEWFVYLCLPLILAVGRFAGVAGLIMASLVTVAGLEVAHAQHALPMWTTLSVNFGMLRAIPTFLLGAALAVSLPHCRIPVASFTPTWIAFGLSIAAMLLGWDDRLIVLLLFITVASAVFAEANGAKGVLTSPALVYLGDLSYAIYMLHPLVATAFISLLGKKVLGLAGWPLTAWCAACVVIPNLLLAALVYRRFELPAQRLVRALHIPRLRPRAPQR